MTEKLDQLIELYGVKDGDAAERKRAAQGRVHEVLSTIFAEVPELNYINAVGDTPGFCDGEPCYHNQQVAVDAYDPDEAMLSFWEEVEGVEDADLDEDQKRILSLLSSRETFALLKWDDEKGNYVESADLTEFQLNVIKAQKLLGALDNDIMLAYDDNVQLEITRDVSGGFTVSSEDYDCGY